MPPTQRGVCSVGARRQRRRKTGDIFEKIIERENADIEIDGCFDFNVHSTAQKPLSVEKDYCITFFERFDVLNHALSPELGRREPLIKQMTCNLNRIDDLMTRCTQCFFYFFEFFYVIRVCCNRTGNIDFHRFLLMMIFYTFPKKRWLLKLKSVL